MEKQHSSAALAGGNPLDAARRRFLSGGDASSFLEDRSRWVDAVVTAAYTDLLESSYPQGLALLAVGGYGRRELFPYSDIDLLLVTAAGPPTGAAREALSRFLQVIWDSGLRLSHSVRTVRECCELHDQNIEFNISVLDRRFLTGDGSLWEEMEARLPKFLQGQRQGLAKHLCKLSRQRHAKFHDTIYHLEPNIKETPGGLRDLHALHWFGRLEVTSAPERLAELEGPRRFLDTLRCFLHFNSGRDNNLLSFEAQEEFAAQGLLGHKEASQVMRDYYRNARAISRAAVREMEAIEGRNNSLLAGFRDWRSRLSNSDFTVARERVLFKAPQRLELEPELALRLFEFMGRHRVALHSESERKLEEALPALRAYFESTANLWPKIEPLLRQPHASFALRGMQDTGVLSALLPEWSLIESYVVRDFNHRYTVDEHTLIVIETLESLAAKDCGQPRFAGLLGEIAKPAVLVMAMLMHDTGKGEETGDHSTSSMRLAEGAAERLGMPEKDRELLRFLIEHHLLLSSAMTGRDLDDPDTAAMLAHKVETIENLKMLTLMTYCDIGAVNPTALSPWRLEQLWRIYLVTYRELTRELETDRIEAAAEGTTEKQAFLKGFPTRYLRVHTKEEIDHHVELNEQRRQAGVAVDIRKQGGVYHLTAVAKDRPYLFASLAGALASFGMNILKAEAFSNQQGTVLDTFAFEDPQRTLELNPVEKDRLRQSLQRVVLGKADVKQLLKNRPIPAPPSKGSRIEPRVNFDGNASSTATLVEVIAEDRPGLLYSLAAAISEAGYSIEVVLVDTEAHRALDVFYVTGNGRKLEPSKELALQEALLTACQN